MNPYKKIVVTTDLSDASKLAFTHADMLSAELESELILLYVQEDISLAEPGKFPGQAVLAAGAALQSDDDQVSKDLQAAVERDFPNSNPKIEFIKSGESPSKAILEYLNTSSASLAVVSTNGRRGIRRAVMGSVAEEISRSAPCPVLLVKAEDV